MGRRRERPLNKPIKREEDVDPDTGYEWDAPTIDDVDNGGD
jgi:hypothetical protein